MLNACNENPGVDFDERVVSVAERWQCGLDQILYSNAGILFLIATRSSKFIYTLLVFKSKERATSRA